MGIKQMLAARRAKRLRFAVLRPPAEVADAALSMAKRATAENSPALLQDAFAVAHSRGNVVFVGYCAPPDHRLFERDGTPTGDTLQSGDLFDEITEFDARVSSGAYQRVEKESQGGTDAG